jgi:D-proline reductase (dithiol) PrdB
VTGSMTKPEELPQRGVDFAQIEREHVRSRLYPEFDWVAFDAFSPLNRMSVTLPDARVALVTTAGAHLPEQEPFDTRSPAGDPSYRVIPSDTPLETLQLSHSGYDTRTAAKDKQVVLPLDHLRKRVRTGVIGELTPSIYSTMGYVAAPGPFMASTGPAIAERLRDEEPDLVLLIPA